MKTGATFVEALSQLDLGPLRVEFEEIEPPDGADANLTLGWEDDRVAFVAEFKNARDLKTVQTAVNQAWRWAERMKREPLVVVPYLNDNWLSFLQSVGMNGVDLAGNGSITVPGRWKWFQRGFPNRFPEATRTRAPYRGTSALVGRVLLSRPRFESIGDIQKEIQRRAGSISLSQVSKVLTALEGDLVVRKGGDGVRLIQAERLLDSLVESYRQPEAIQEAHLKVDLGPGIFAALMSKAKAAKSRIAGFEPARYAIAPESGGRLLVYIEPRGFSSVSTTLQAEPSRRFANIEIRSISGPQVFFDPEEEGGFKWCSLLETYLQLMQGGKRERDAATQLRAQILDKAATDR